MSEITPAYFPLESCFSPCSPEEASTTVYPRRSSAARKNAITEGSSSISRIGRLGDTAGCALIAPTPWQPPRPVHSPLPPESAQQRCFRRRLHCSSTESRPHVHAQSRSKCSAPVRCPCLPAWLYRRDRKSSACR